MVDRIQFDEAVYPDTSAPQAHPSKVVSFLIKNGIVENATQANIILIGFVIICILGAAFFISSFLSDQVPVVAEDQTDLQ